MTTERLDIIVEEKGARSVRRRIEEIGEGARTTGGAVELLKRALLGLGAAAVIRQLTSYAEQFAGMNNLLRASLPNQRAVNSAIAELGAIAGRTRAPLSAITQLYQRGSIAAAELGASQEQLFQFTEAVGLALAQQGGGAAAASGALLQLSQALGAGVVRAEEFNSILEGAFPIAQAAARGLDAAGGSVARLRQLIISGEVSSRDFFNAILSQMPQLQAAFANTVPTIGQAFTVLNNNLVTVVGGLDQALGLSAGFASVIIFLANNLQTFVNVLGVAASALAGYLVTTVRLTAASGVLSGAITAVSGAFRLLTAAIAANPIGALAAAIAAVVSALVIWRNEISVTSDGVVKLGDVFGAIMDFIGSAVAPVARFFSDVWSGSLDQVSEGFSALYRAVVFVLNAILQAARTAVNRFIGLWVGTFQALEAAYNQLVSLFSGQSGPSIQEAFLEGFNRDYIGDAVGVIMERARERAAARVAGTPTTPGTPASPAVTAANAGRAARETARAARVASREIGALEKAGIALGRTLSGIFDNATEALTQFVMTGKLDFRSLVSSMLADLARLTIQQTVMSPLLNIVGGALSSAIGGAFGTGIRSALGLGGGLSSPMPTPRPLATGASFTVGGSGGVDSQMVAFRASPGERVDVSRRGEETSSGSTVINFNITTPDADSFRRSEGQLAARVARQVQRGRRNM